MIMKHKKTKSLKNKQKTEGQSAGLKKWMIFLAIGAAVVAMVAVIIVFLLLPGSPEELPEGEMAAAIKQAGWLDRRISAAEYEFFETYVGRDLWQPTEEELTEKTRRFIYEVNAKHGLGAHLGLCDPFTFESMQRDVVEGNIERARMQAAGEVFYGPVSYDDSSHFKVTFAKLEVEIVNELQHMEAGGEIEFVEDDLHDFYQEYLFRYQRLAAVTYEHTIGGHTEVRTAPWSELRTMHAIDDYLAGFLMSGEVGDEVEYYYDVSFDEQETRSAKILDIEIDTATFEDARYALVMDYITLVYYPQIIEEAIEHSKLSF